ncbi:ABC transporter substrate-binding protein [Luedemannella helvata]|uniref:ABC transporter substrate-binding protein n=1 Tax=Luedemannella helvata TaxID=349315 RepID=A0ABN2L5W6_9ACTN
MRLRRCVGHLLVTVVAVLGAGACDAGRVPTAPPVPVTIALAADPGDTDVLNGARLAVDLVNEFVGDLTVPLAAQRGLPGLGGAPLRLVTVDTGSPAALTKVPGRLSAEGAVAVICAGPTATAIAVSGQTERLRLPFIDALTSTDNLADLGHEWYFRTAPTDRMLAEAAFGLLRHQQVAAAARVRLGVLHDGRADNLLALVRQLAGTAGYRTVVEVDTRTGPDYAIASEIALAGATVVVSLAGTNGGATTAARVAGALPVPAPVLAIGPGFAGMAATAPAGEPVVLRAVGWSAEYVSRNPLASAIAERYKKRFGKAMTAAAAEAFTATLTLAVALDTAGDADPTAVRAALRQMWLPATQLMLPWNGVRFDATGQNTLAGAVVEARTRTGFRVVYPRELSTVPVPW